MESIEEEEFDPDLPKMRANAIQIARAMFHHKHEQLPEDSPLKTSNMAQKLAQNEAKNKVKLAKEDIVPTRYHNYLGIFDEGKSN